METRNRKPFTAYSGTARLMSACLPSDWGLLPTAAAAPPPTLAGAHRVTTERTAVTIFCLFRARHRERTRPEQKSKVAFVVCAEPPHIPFVRLDYLTGNVAVGRW